MGATLRGSVRRRVPDWLGHLAPLYLVPPVLLIGLWLVSETEVGPGVGLIAVLGLTAFVVIALMKTLARLQGSGDFDTTLAVEGDALVTRKGGEGEARAIPKTSLRRGVVIPEGIGARLVLSGVRTGLDVRTPDREGARALLAELGLSAAHKPHTFAFFFGLRVTVGLDGILVAWPLLGRRRFVAYGKITRVTATDTRIRLKLTDGGRYDIETGTGAKGEVSEGHRALLERIDDARAAYAASERAESVALLARGGRTTEAWVRELRALASGGAAYRAASLLPETLVRIATDPAETEELRIGAALALRATGDDEARTKVRVAAEASASPRVRLALTASTDDLDDATLVETLRARSRKR